MTAAEFRDTLFRLGMKHGEFADTLGLAKSTVSAWANGKAEVAQYAVAYLDERAKRLAAEQALARCAEVAAP